MVHFFHQVIGLHISRRLGILPTQGFGDAEQISITSSWAHGLIPKDISIVG